MTALGLLLLLIPLGMPAEDEETQFADQLADRSDAELLALLDRQRSQDRIPGFGSAAVKLDLVLSEIIERDSDALRAGIEERLFDESDDEPDEEAGEADGKPERDGEPPVCDLLLLTAHRRLQGQPDPTRITVEGLQPGEGLTTVELLDRHLEVAIEHRDELSDGGASFMADTGRARSGVWGPTRWGSRVSRSISMTWS